MIDPTPQGMYRAADQLLSRAPGFFSDEEDPVFDAVLALTPALRRKFSDQHLEALWHLLSMQRFFLLRTLAYGTEAQALIARLRLATEGRIDDAAAVQAVVDRAVGLLRERRELQASLARGTLPAEVRATAEARLAELTDLDDLLKFTPGAGGGFEAGSFMGKLASARGDEETFGADARRLAEFAIGANARGYALAVAKQRILLAGADVDGIQAIVMSVHAPRVEVSAPGGPAPGPSAQQAEDVRLRQELLADPAVDAVIGKLKGFDRRLVDVAVQAGPFEETLNRVKAAMNGAQWGEFFRLIMVIARNDDWRARFRATATDPTSPYARAHGDIRAIMEEILASPQQMPLEALFAYSGNVDLLRTALSELPEDQRGRLRLGRFLASRVVPIGPPTQEQDKALSEYRAFEAQLRASQTSWLGTFDAAGFQDVLDAALGSEPTMAEIATAQGRFRAAELMYQQQRARLGLERGLSAEFTETDETMVAAAQEFAARFEPLRPAGTLTAVDFAALSALHARFETRTGEFVEASNMVGEMAGMVAATVAGVVVIAATGGTAAPGVIAWAAASGAGARVLTRQMFGGEYYNALSDAGARDALLGAIDAALAVVGQSLAARGAELLGLGERALAKGAAHLAGEVAEQATQTLSKKVAAGAVEAALDGAFSGAVSQAVGTMTDARTWRRGVWQGLVQVGEAALVAGLTGLATGGLTGAAMPVLGATARWLRNAVVGQRVENTLARAGATETLVAARRAAQAGNVDEVSQLAAQLESHLSPEEAAALRQELNAELRNTLRHPPGTATAASESQARLLAESSALEGPLGREHLDAERDIVRRSEPQPSTVDGYVDEVDLGNQHTWRRRADGTWCRFTKPTLCGTPIPGAKAMDPAMRAKVAARQSRIKLYGEHAAAAREAEQELPEIITVLEANPRADGRINLQALSPDQQEVLRQVFDQLDEEALSRLTLQDVKAASGKSGREATRWYTRQEAEIEKLRLDKRPLLERLHDATPQRQIDQALKRAGKLDEFSRLAPPSGELDVDHVVPLRSIVDMPGFAELDWADQVAIANDPANLRAIDRSANRARGDTLWSQWDGRYPNGQYHLAALRRASQQEDTALAVIKERIKERLSAKGLRPALR